jgi:hypothetical protein
MMSVQLTDSNSKPLGIIVGGFQVCPLFDVERVVPLVAGPAGRSPTTTQVESRVHETAVNDIAG